MAFLIVRRDRSRHALVGFTLVSLTILIRANEAGQAHGKWLPCCYKMDRDLGNRGPRVAE